MEPKVKFQNETFETLRIKMKTALHKNFKINIKIMKTIPNVRVFASSRIKISINFNKITYFFYFTYSLFKTSQIKLSIFHYISLKYQTFLIF